MNLTLNNKVKMAKKDTSMKGEAGKKTGGSARKSINAAQKKGATNAEIGRKTNRSPSTIAKIDKGTIKNPPKSLIPKLKKAAKSTGKKSNSKPSKRKPTPKRHK